MPGASYATLATHCAKTRKIPSSIYYVISRLPYGSGIRLEPLVIYKLSSTGPAEVDQAELSLQHPGPS